MSPRLACSSFATVDAVLARESCAYSEADTDLLQQAIDAASDVMYILSGGVLTGRCSATFRPRKARSHCADAWSQEYGVDCIPLTENLLSVTRVKVDGAVLTTDDYGLIDGYILFRKGGQRWPTAQNIALADTEIGTFSVAIEFGILPDWMASAACVEMALQLAEDEANRPGYLRNMTSANIQGASVTIADAADEMVGRNLPMLERWMGVFAPRGTYGAGVWAPEVDNGWTLAIVS